MGLRDRADRLGALDAELGVGHLSPSPDGGRPRARGAAHGARSALRRARDPPLPRRRLPPLDSLRRIRGRALLSRAGDRAPRARRRPRDLASRGGGRRGRRDPACRRSSRPAVPRRLGVRSDPPRHGRLAPSSAPPPPAVLRPRLRGHAARRRLHRRRLDSRRQLHRDGRGRRRGGGGAGVRRSRDASGAGRRRKEALFAVLLGAAIAIPLYAGGRLLSASGACLFSTSASSRGRRSSSSSPSEFWRPAASRRWNASRAASPSSAQRPIPHGVRSPCAPRRFSWRCRSRSRPSTSIRSAGPWTPSSATRRASGDCAS